MGASEYGRKEKKCIAHGMLNIEGGVSPHYSPSAGGASPRSSFFKHLKLA
jgi:hypothetical protein